MVELQIVILAVAGSSPVGHPGKLERALAQAVLNRNGVNKVHTTTETMLHPTISSFWSRLLRDRSLEPLSDLEKILAGCEIIAALDDLELLEK